MNTTTPHTEGDEFDKFNHIADGRILATPAELLAWRDKAVAVERQAGKVNAYNDVLTVISRERSEHGNPRATLEYLVNRLQAATVALTPPEEKR